MLAPTKALSLVLQNSPPQPLEQVALDQTAGRILARPVRADRDMPAANRSAMDGFAVRSADLVSIPCELKLVGEVAAGSPALASVRPGTCVYVSTGANIPRGADAVAIVESTEKVSATVVRFRSRVDRGENILRRGENAHKGQILLRKGIRLGPMQIAVCASVGADPVHVYRRPRVGVLCTGRELVSSSSSVSRHTERNTNGPALCAALRISGLVECQLADVADDDPRVLERKVRRALDVCNVLLLVGGVSVGKYDFVPRVLKSLGCREVFHGVVMKPGKPTLFALGPERQLVFGLPGNPLSAMAGFCEFVMPALRKMSGVKGQYLPTIHVRLHRPLTWKRSGRMRLLPARIHFESDGGAPTVVPVATHSSADVAAGGQSHGILVLPAGENHRDRGNLLEFHPWSWML